MPAFFCIPGAASTPVSLYPLASILSGNRVFYSYLYPGLNDDAEVHDNPLKLADDIFTEIKTMQPDGPYCLGGYCLGGILAYEIADRLIQGGEKVALLLLLDTLPPIRLGRAGQAVPNESELPPVVLRRNQNLIENPGSSDSALETRLASIAPEIANRIRRTRDAHNRAITKYAANRINLNLTLITTNSYLPEDVSIWEKFTMQDFESTKIECGKNPLIEQPGVTLLADALDRKFSEFG